LIFLAVGLAAYVRSQRSQPLQATDRQSSASSENGDAPSVEPKRGQQETENPSTLSKNRVETTDRDSGNRVGDTPVKRRQQKQIKEVIAQGSSKIESERGGLDLRIGRHIENSQLLLRAFRNINEDEKVIDVWYERQRSRLLLQQNILLRRNAEAEGNLPVQEMLEELEPLLLDIANLPGKPRHSDVAIVKERIEKKEMIASLQVYSTIASSN
jgi:hypothetical protein